MEDNRSSDEISWTVSLLANKILSGIVSLAGKEVAVGVFSVLGTTLLARLLSPSDFGLFAIITFGVGFLGAIGNVGVGASLITMDATPSLQDYRAVFTVEQIIGLIVVGGMWLLSPVLAHAYKLGSAGIWMFRIASWTIWLSSFRTISAIKLERKLQIGWIATVETLSVVVYYGVAVGLAWTGWGAWSFVWALLIRTIVVTILSFVLQPWPLRWGKIKRSFWSNHLRFGVTYQASTFTSLIKDSFTPIVVGLLLGTQAVGYLKWASTLAVYSLWALTGLNRIYFPAISRLRSFPEQLKIALEQIVWLNNSIVAPIAMFLLVVIRPITFIIYGSRWEAALPLFYLFWAANVIVPTVMPLGSLFNALGQPRRMLFFSTVWMIGEWGLGLPLVLWLGSIGIAMANLAVQSTNIILLHIADKTLQTKLWKQGYWSWLLAGAMGLIAKIIIVYLNCPIKSIQSLFFIGLVWATVYGTAWGLHYKKALRQLSIKVRRWRNDNKEIHNLTSV